MPVGGRAGVQRLAAAHGSMSSVHWDLRPFHPPHHNRKWRHNLTVNCSRSQPIAAFGEGSPAVSPRAAIDREFLSRI